MIEFVVGVDGSQVPLEPSGGGGGGPLLILLDPVNIPAPPPPPTLAIATADPIIVPELVGRSFSGLSIFWPSDVATLTFFPLSVFLSSAELGEVTMSFLAIPDSGGWSNARVMLAVWP